MIQQSKLNDECRLGKRLECWCLHGAVGLASDWRELTRVFAENGVASRSVDLWRFLECSSLSLPETAVALNAEAAANACDAVPKVLVGYSLGGRLALHSLLAAAGPTPWSAAIIISAHPGLTDERERAERRATDAAWAAQAFAGSWNDFLTNWNAQPVLGQAFPRHDADARRLMARRREIARSFVEWSLGKQDSLWERLTEIRIPVLWVVGANDRKFRLLAERAVTPLPSATLEIVPDCGHRVPWDKPRPFSEMCQRFLSMHADDAKSGNQR